MIKINYFFVIATAQLLSEIEVPKFTGAEVRLFLRIWSSSRPRKFAHKCDSDVGDIVMLVTLWW